ncbi:MAG: hypothetical protein R2932_26425 [Caldilineaceae bacterium]
MIAVPRTSRAHGGVIVDTGFTDHYEWLVSIDPFPTLMGQATLTLLVYDIATYEPVNELAVTLFLADPEAPRPCCQPEVHTGPVTLTVDPQIYPGDYSNVVTFDQPGDWELQFVATAPDAQREKTFAIVVPMTIHATMGGSERIPIEAGSTPDVDATATVFAQNINDARLGNSPVATPVAAAVDGAPASPLPAETASTLATPVGLSNGTNWLLWGGLALLPILLIGWFTLRSPAKQDDPVDE